MDKVLIEEGSVDLIKLFRDVGDEAKKEKNAIPPINEILYWWTRKPLIVARAVVLTSTLRDLESAKSLLLLGKDRRAYTYSPNVEVFAKKLGVNPEHIKILDPFAGAGNLIFEAQRLGLDCTAQEYNPVAYLLSKAVLEYRPKYPGLAKDVEKYGSELIETVRKELKHLYGGPSAKTSIFLWAWCIRCPFCGQRFPLLNQFSIVRTKKQSLELQIHVTNRKNFKLEIKKNKDTTKSTGFTQKGGKAICIKCRNSIVYSQIVSDISTNKDREMIAVVRLSPNGKLYEIPNDEDKKNFVKAAEYLKKNWESFEDEELIPHEKIRPDHRRENLLWHYGINEWHEYFNERQLLVMLTVLRSIRKTCRDIPDQNYARVIATFLGFALCKHVNSNAMGTPWNTQRETAEFVLAFRRPSFVYNFVEINPFEKARGSLDSVLRNIVEGIEFASTNHGKTKVENKSVLHLSEEFNHEFDLIITDPPYMDDVQYAELSDFFFVWLERALADYYKIPKHNAPIEEDISVSWGRFGNKQVAQEFYNAAMKKAFLQINVALKEDGLLVIFFAHSSPEAWNLLLEVLREAQFRVTSSFAVHTESVSNMIARGKTSFMSSIIVACRKISNEKETYFEDLLPRIEDKIRSMLSTLSTNELLALPMTDLLIMSYGKVLEETTQHTKLKSYKADFKPEFESLIGDARQFILKEIVAKLTGRSPNVLGPESSFYVVTKVFYNGILSGDEALKIALAYQLRLDDLHKRQVIKNDEGLTKLLFYDEIHTEGKPDQIESSNLHQQLLFLENTTSLEGLGAVRRILSQNTNFRVQDLKQIIELLIKAYRSRLNRNESLSDKERAELDILEALADSFGSRSQVNGESLDSYSG